MKTETYTTKAGKEGVKNVPQAGDRFTSLFSAVKSDTETGKFPMHSLQVENSNKEKLYLKISGGQLKSLVKAGDLKGKTLEFYSYENQYGTQVGVKVI